MNTTLTLAKFIVQSDIDSIPGTVRHEAARALLNWCACAVGGAAHETVDNALAAVMPFAGPQQASVLGRKERMDILNAALINGISSHVLDFDDRKAMTGTTRSFCWKTAVRRFHPKSTPARSMV